LTTDKSTVWVLDSSALIAMKTIPVSDQWQVFRQMEDMVTEGEIALPRQVINELKEIAHPDVPGVWAAGMRRSVRHPQDADPHDVRHVMSVAGEVVDHSKRTEDADPYVVALALTLGREGHVVCIVSDDAVDHPPRISLVTACARLELPVRHPRSFSTVGGCIFAASVVEAFDQRSGGSAAP